MKVRRNTGLAKRGRAIIACAGLTQLARAAVHTKDTYLFAFYRRLAARLERLGYRVHLEPVVATTEWVIFKVTRGTP